MRAETAVMKAGQAEAVAGAAPDGVGAKKAKGGKRSRPAVGRTGENGEMISPLLAAPFPPDFDFIASKTNDEKIEYIRSVLARSEDEAVAIITPALQFYGTAALVVEAYLPLILEAKEHFCRPGRPKINPATGERNKTWEEICKENFHISIRRMQQILAHLKESRSHGKGGTTSRRPGVGRKEYERAKQVCRPCQGACRGGRPGGAGKKIPRGP